MAPPPSGEFSIRLTKPFSTLPSLPEPTYEPLTHNPPSPPPQNLIRPSTTNTPSSHSRHNTDRKNRIHRRAQPPRHRKSHHPRWCTKPDYLDQAGGGSSVPIPLPPPLPSPPLPSPPPSPSALSPLLFPCFRSPRLTSMQRRRQRAPLPRQATRRFPHKLGGGCLWARYADCVDDV